MIWGLGTGRCGTRSLAAQYGGLHEPKPWFKEEARNYWMHGEEELLRHRIKERAKLDTPLVVDFKQSWCIPLILEIDPDARFVWLIRDAVDCVNSMVAGKWWSDRDWHGTRRIEPRAGWTPLDGRMNKCVWYWLTTNRIIDDHLSKLDDERYAILPTVMLKAHKNRYEASSSLHLSEEEVDWVRKKTEGMGRVLSQALLGYGDYGQPDWLEQHRLAEFA